MKTTHLIRGKQTLLSNLKYRDKTHISRHKKRLRVWTQATKYETSIVKITLTNSGISQSVRFHNQNPKPAEEIHRLPPRSQNLLPTVQNSQKIKHRTIKKQKPDFRRSHLFPSKSLLQGSHYKRTRPRRFPRYRNA